MENMIKEHKLYTKSDRTSCHRWEANQFRLFLHSGAYWLLHQLRQAAPRRSPWRKATFETIRRVFLKIAVRIEELKSRVRVALPTAYSVSQGHDLNWQAASPPKAPDPGGACRRMSPERQPPTSPKTHLEAPPSTRSQPLAPSNSASRHE